MIDSSRRVADAPSTATFRSLLALFVACIAVQAILLTNPGYYSHDELQWAAFADAAGANAPTWVSWLDLSAFQYRPLTFNLWLVLSPLLFDRPHVFHALWVVLGAGNAVLLALAVRGAGGEVRNGAIAALVFVLNPFAAYVHGWVATLADLLWVGIALAATLWLQRRGARAMPDVPAICIGALATVLALLAKEAAIVLPALAALAAWADVRRRPTWLAAAAGAGAAVLAYLALRLPALLHGARPDSAYAWDLGNLLLRWTEYQYFLLLAPGKLEIQSLGLTSALRHAAFALPALAVAALLARRNWRRGFVWLAAGAIALGPVLVLQQSANQYGYGFSAVAVAIPALAWRHCGRCARVVLLVFAASTVLHGIQIQLRLVEAGQRQARFSPALAQALARHPRETPLVLHVEDAKYRFLYERLTHDIPQFAGVPIGDQVRLGTAEEADCAVRDDGSLHCPAR